MEMIARTARWVHPDTFNALPVWCPDTARGRPRYDATWSRELISGRGVRKVEENIRAAIGLMEALGVKGKPKNWTVCHIWGYDDEECRREEQCRTRPAVLFLHWQHDLVTNRVQASIEKRKAKFREQLADSALEHYGHDVVREVLTFWKVRP